MDRPEGEKGEREEDEPPESKREEDACAEVRRKLSERVVKDGWERVIRTEVVIRAPGEENESDDGCSSCDATSLDGGEHQATKKTAKRKETRGSVRRSSLALFRRKTKTDLPVSLNEI